jgi:hypothetical protein
MEVYNHINPYTHKQAIYGYTLISIYEGEREGVGGRGLEVRFSTFWWKDDNSVFLHFCGRVWKRLGGRVAKYISMGI